MLNYQRVIHFESMKYLHEISPMARCFPHDPSESHDPMTTRLDSEKKRSVKIEKKGA